MRGSVAVKENGWKMRGRPKTLKKVKSSLTK